MHVSLDNPLVRADLESLAAHLHLLEPLRGRHLLITGGTGFFGRWLLALCDWLNEQGWALRVTVVSRDPQEFLRREPAYRTRAWLGWIHSPLECLPLQELQVDYLLHAATDTSAAGQADGIALLDSIYQGTRRVLELAAQGGVKRVLLTGSGAQYGASDAADGRLHERSASACPSGDGRHVYGEAKRVQEMLGALFAQRYGFEVLFSRCFAFVGAGLPLDGHFAIGNFIRDALAQTPIRLNSAGTALRSYLYGADLAVWLLGILASGSAGGVYNVGSDQALSILELARRVAGLLAPGLAVQAREATGNEIRQAYVPDLSNARGLGLDIWTSLDRAILRTAAWHLHARGAVA